MAVIYRLVRRRSGISLPEMKPYHHQGSYSPQPVKQPKPPAEID